MRRLRIPIATIAGIAFDLVQHRVNPARERIVVVLHDVVRALPVVGEGGGDCVLVELAHARTIDQVGVWGQAKSAFNLIPRLWYDSNEGMFALYDVEVQAQNRRCFMNELDQLKTRLRQFAEERDWDQFHSPKNLSMALIAEAAELVEHFQWLTEAQSASLSPDKLKKVEEELADILIYLVRAADKLGVNLIDAARNKIEVNEQKYPADKAKGSAKKYTEY